MKLFGTSRNNITFYLPSNVTELKKDGERMQEKVLQLQFHQKIKQLITYFIFNKILKKNLNANLILYHMT